MYSPQKVSIPIVPRNELLPLSYNQENKVHMISQTGESTNNLISVYSTDQRLDPLGVKETIAELIRHHEILRTSYRQYENCFVQVVETDVSFSFTELELRDSKEENVTFENLIGDEAKRPTKLDNLPNLRSFLVHTNNTDAIIMAVNHIAFDGWSRHIMRRDFAKLYSQRSGRSSRALNTSNIQYADYASWERREPLNSLYRRELEHWKRVIGDSPEVFPFPSDFERPITPTYMTGWQRGILVSGTRLNDLEKLAGSQKVTLSILITSAFLQLMHLWTDETTFLVRTTLPNRRLPQLKGMIGFLANRTLLGVRTPRQLTIRELITKTRDVVLETYVNHEVPFRVLVTELVSHKNSEVPPLTQVEFRIERKLKETEPQGTAILAPDAFELSEFRGGYSDEVTIGSSKRNRTYGTDLSMTVWRYRNALEVSVSYNSVGFRPHTITELITQFRNIVRSLPDRLDESLWQATSIR